MTPTMHSRNFNENHLTFCRLLVLLLCFGSFCGFYWWDPLAKWIGIGNKASESEDYEKAEEAYKNAQKIVPESPELSNNLGILYHQKNNPEEAQKYFKQALSNNNPELQAQAWYNLGCSQLSSGKPEEAIASFQNSLLMNPHDNDAKTNLEIARMILEQMPTPTPQSQENQQEQNESDEQQTPAPEQTGEITPTPSGAPKNSEMESVPTPTPETTQTPQASEAQPVEKETPPTPEPEQEGEMSKEEALRLLDAMEQDELEVLKRFHNLPPVDERTIEKDW